MGTYRGTYAADYIAPLMLSAGVSSEPAGTRPSSGGDVIDGLEGNDILDGGGGGDTIRGGSGSDTISDRNLRMESGNAGNIIYGNAGDDEVTLLIHDSGNINRVDNVVFGEDGNDAVTVQIGDWSYLTGEYWEGQQPVGSIFLSGGAGDDALQVESYDTKVSGVSTALHGEAGSDELRATRYYWEPDGSYSGGAAVDELYGGVGDDEYFIYDGGDFVTEEAGQGVDTVVADNMSYSLPANVENLAMTYYTFWFPDEDYTAIGNALDNTIKTIEDYWFANYTIEGLAGNDTIYGSAGGDDGLDGGAGNDTIYGKQLGFGPFEDPPVEGGSDADTIHGGDGNDLIYGAGSGSDTWDGDDLIYGDAGNDTLHGVIGNDRMFGGDGTDLMFGGEGDDTMDGGLGNDDLRGQNGTDTLTGGAGLDRLMGGAGSDTFDYNAVTDSRPTATYRDVITTAFDGVGAAAGDRIDLATIDANTGASGNQAFAFRGTAAFTGAGQIRVAASGSDTLIQANTGGTTAPELEILVKDGAALPGQWAAADFIL